jgi:threonine dehydratase
LAAVCPNCYKSPHWLYNLGMTTLNDIEAAAQRLQGQILETPCVESRTLSQIVGAQVFLKFENLQFTASFKERGACNKMVDVAASEGGARGVVAMSAGNHAQGVAYHAQRLGCRPPSSCRASRPA